MDDRRLVRVSKFLSKYLRHEPQALGLVLEPGGWVSVTALLEGAARAAFPISPQELADVVSRNDKQRFSFDETGLRIRANQGHSAPVDLLLSPVPSQDVPAELYHGTVERFVPAILREGLRPMQRHHVHLSADVPTATRVGARRGRPVILSIAAGSMCRAGISFYRSQNGVWLVDAVDPRYIQVLATP